MMMDQVFYIVQCTGGLLNRLVTSNDGNYFSGVTFFWTRGVRVV